MQPADLKRKVMFLRQVWQHCLRRNEMAKTTLFARITLGGAPPRTAMAGVMSPSQQRAIAVTFAHEEPVRM